MRRFHFLLLLLLTTTTVLAQRFTSKVEEVNGYYRLTFTVTSRDVSDFTPPSLADFNILNGPSTSSYSNYQLINGKASHEETTSYTYILSAKKSGNLRIGGATIRVGGRLVRSNAVSLNAKKGEEGGGRPDSGNGNAPDQTVQRAGSRVSERDLFIDVTPSRTRVKEQEAVLLTYRVHARAGVGLSNTMLANKPDFKNLISHEIPLPGNQIQTTIEQRGGLTYRTGVILQYVVFPQIAGEVKIPSITFDCSVEQEAPNMSLIDAFFNGGGRIGVQVKRKVSELTISVDKLPEPRPADFAGGVGHMTMEGSLTNPQIRTNDVATYRIRIKGIGNLKLLTAPGIAFPKDFETYETKTNEQSRVTANGLEGEVTFDYTFIPRNVGEYTIPAVTFTYYNTETEAYETLKTNPLKVNVQKGERSNADVDKQLALLKSDIRDLHQSEGTPVFDSLSEWGTTGYRLLELTLVLIFGLLIYGLKKVRGGNLHLSKGPKAASRRALVALDRQARPLIESPNEAAFYEEVAKVLNTWLEEGFGLKTFNRGSKEIAEMLDNAGLSAASIERILSLYETCNAGRFSPTIDTNRADTYALAKECFTLVR